MITFTPLVVSFHPEVGTGHYLLGMFGTNIASISIVVISGFPMTFRVYDSDVLKCPLIDTCAWHLNDLKDISHLRYPV
jgi:hypothetical protein